MKLCGFEAGLHQPLFLIAGPCVVESRELQIETADLKLKLESEGLFWVAGKQKHSFRSEIEDMNAGRAPTLSNEAKEISKHFGIYKQTERVDGRKTHDYIFMLRMRVPGGGELSGAQWRAICEASDRFADGTVRLTTRRLEAVTPMSMAVMMASR